MMKLKTMLILSFLTIAITAGVVGIVGIYYTNQVGSGGLNAGEKLAPLGDAAMEIKLSSVNAHLAIEEAITSGIENDAHIFSLLDESLWYAKAILNGGENKKGRIYPSNDAKVRQNIEKVVSSLNSFISSAKDRMELAKNGSGAGSKEDADFDGVYDMIQVKLDSIIETYQSSQYTSVIRNAGSAKYLLANGHLFFEEMLSGDDGNKIEDILADFINAKANVVDIENQLNLKSDISNDIAFFIETTKKREKFAIQLQQSTDELEARFQLLFDTFITAADTAENLVRNEIFQGYKKLKADKTSANGVVVSITVISFVLALFIAFFTTRQIMRPLGAEPSVVSGIAENIAAGRLDVKIDTKGQAPTGLMAAMIDMTGSLSSLVKTTANSMVEASEGTAKILLASQEMSSSVNKQTEQVEQIAAAVEELSNSSLEVANNCVDASDSSTSTLALAKSGGEVVQKTLSQMVVIKDAFDNSSQAISILSTQSKEIENILNVIKGIADQTNLLALNAAIEAARAGEQGRGFAVVADEVRQLAGRTTEATVEVESAISTMSKETVNAVTMMNEGGDKVTLGVDMTKNAAASLNDIIGSVDDVVLKIQAIAATAEEQSMTTAEVAQNTELVSEASQQIQKGVSDIVELSITVSENTKTKANELLDMV